MLNESTEDILHDEHDISNHPAIQGQFGAFFSPLGNHDIVMNAPITESYSLKINHWYTDINEFV